MKYCLSLPWGDVTPEVQTDFRDGHDYVTAPVGALTESYTVLEGPYTAPDGKWILDPKKDPLYVVAMDCGPAYVEQSCDGEYDVFARSGSTRLATDYEVEEYNRLVQSQK